MVFNRPNGDLCSFEGLPMTDEQVKEVLTRPNLPEFLELDATPEMVSEAASWTLYRARRGLGDSVMDALDLTLGVLCGYEKAAAASKENPYV